MCRKHRPGDYFNLLVFVLLVLLPSAGTFGQEILFRVNGTPAYSDEFEYAYSKNSFNNPESFTKRDLQEYFDLYLNFKLKVAEAKALGLDTVRSLKNEFESYKVQIRKPYMSDDNIADSLVRAAYDRLYTEVRAAHILLRTAPDALPEDTLKVYQKIMDIRKQAIEGADFSKLAEEYSEDPGGKVNGGDLGYFTSMQMVFPFEDAAYRLNPGEISMPVRTQFGYHLIKVNDKRETKGRARAAHIMIRFNRNMNAADSLEKREKIFEIAQQLAEGADWDELCNTWSEDISTKSTGGLLRPFRVGNLPPAFAEATYNLDQPGDISDPFMTPFGWHIVKLVEYLEVEPFEEMEATILGRVNSDARAQIKEEALIAKLVRENKVEFDPAYDEMKNLLPSGIDSGRWEEPLFSIKEQTFNLSDIMRDGRLEISVANNFNNFMIDYEEEHLADKYPEYRHLLNEYWEGILLFQVMEQEVWNKATQDSIGIERFFNENRENYIWKERIEGTLYKSPDKEVIDSLSAFLSATNDTLDLNEVLKYFNQENQLSLQGERGPFERGSERLPDGIKWENINQNGETGSMFYLLNVKSIKAPGLKELDEVKGLVISDYQDYLEKEWIRELREKYEIDIDKKNVKNVIKRLQK